MSNEQELIAEINRLEQWINDCQAGMFINCVYCGHRYGPDDGNHLKTMRAALEDHISQCPKHPLSAAKNRIKQLESDNQELLAACHLVDDMISAPDPNCSCHISPPCPDCIEFGGTREALKAVKEAIANAEGVTKTE